MCLKSIKAQSGPAPSRCTRGPGKQTSQPSGVEGPPDYYNRNMQKAMSWLMAILILAATAVQSSEPSGNLTQQTPHPRVSAPTHTLNGSMEEPRVLRMSRPCQDEHRGYCEHGQCMYPQDSDKPSCTCLPPYVGDRCMFVYIVNPSQSDSRIEGLIGIILGVAFLLCFLGIAVYCCLRTRCKTSSPPYKPYGSENSV
ncbi:LOW QUALITY PROTEIN: epigen [Osmerus mordax]|uniref:LOW QUALITY PROTEIN: epigen n=1 Tax=Osmerus mordax TaxID=8014 RepID=UPI0035105C91